MHAHVHPNNIIVAELTSGKLIRTLFEYQFDFLMAAIWHETAISINVDPLAAIKTPGQFFQVISILLSSPILDTRLNHVYGITEGYRLTIAT